MRDIKQVDGTFLYELNPKGYNKWDCQLQGGWNDNDTRTTPEELVEVATKLRAAEEMYAVLDNLAKSLFTKNPHGVDLHVSQADIDAMLVVIAKARGEKK